MSTEREHNPWWHLPGQIVLQLSKARLIERRDINGQKYLEDNVDSPEVLEELDIISRDPNHPEHQKWNTLSEQVSNGHKVAKFAVTFGTITITLASIGYEAFVRGGRDVRYILELLEDHRKKKQ